MEIQMIENQIAGLKESLTALNQNKDDFVKAQGVQQEERKIRVEIVGKKESLTEKKVELSQLKITKAEAVQETSRGLAEKMGEVLPRGTAVLEIEDGKVFIGWGNTPYNGLSGGEKVIFDGALAHALDASILCYEAAEVDLENLDELIKRLSQSDKQILLSTWVRPTTIPDGWTVVELDGPNPKI